MCGTTVGGKHHPVSLAPSLCARIPRPAKEIRRLTPVGRSGNDASIQRSRRTANIGEPRADPSFDEAIAARHGTANVKDLENTMRTLEKRERQTAILADLGRIALSTADLQSLFDRAVSEIAQAVDNDLCKILELLPGGEDLRLVSGIGWKDGLIGAATVHTGLDSQAGYTLRSAEPVIVRDLRTETRFSGPELLTDHGVISGMSVVIGAPELPWGVLGTHSTVPMEFSGEDANFIQAVANILWHAIDRKNTEDSLRQSDRRKEEFLAMLGHELRNPLASISTALEITRITDDTKTIEHSRAIVDRQVRHLTRLVDDLLEVSRINQGRLQLRKARVDLSDLIHSAITDTRHLLESRGHSLSLTVPREPAYLDADPVRLTQVFSNLLSNAAKYTPDGGRIRITVRFLGDGLSVSVRDNGIGIPREHLKTVFQMFAGLNRSPEPMQKGMGIGLSLVKALVELHGGKVSARSKGVGQGSVFSVWLPADLRATEVQQVAEESEHKTGSDACRVLVVEDNEDAADSLAKLLELLGHETRIASDGHAALEAAQSFRPDLVLLDIGLPKMNGYEVARRIRAEPWGDGIVLAAVTGWGQEPDKARSRDAGIDRHLTKPLTLPVLKEILAGV